MDLIHQRYDPLIGAAAVEFLERLQVFNVFSSAWFSASLVLLLISIVACTLNRTPRLWRQSTDIRVVQPDPFFDPVLPDRAAIAGLDVAATRTVLRRHHFRVREATVDGTAYLYGDRHQYTKLATLFTHLGLILFLVAAAVTSRLGFEAPLVIAAGETSTVQPIGTPNLLVVQNLGFDAPRLPDGQIWRGKTSRPRQSHQQPRQHGHRQISQRRDEVPQHDPLVHEAIVTNWNDGRVRVVHEGSAGKR
jgi:cytochrome c biogenesis protein ResB